MPRFRILLILIVVSVMLVHCDDSTKKNKTSQTVIEADISIPEFNEDSAYKFVEEQVGFGPRVPNTHQHEDCSNFLEITLDRFVDEVIVQDFSARAFDGTILNGKNIIGSFNPERKSRIMLCSHWDSRPFADHDIDPNKHNLPIDGANDGASGVGVLLEIARLLKINNPPIGVDIVFFDLEDYGPDNDNQSADEQDFWGLGSQYWSRNTHKYNYKARYVILLDMVGVPDPEFRKEGFSMYYASDKVKKVWNIAKELGYEKYFLDEQGGYITDDHYYINKLKGIPAINIIHLDPTSSNGSFFDHWHTTKDDMKSIDKKSLGIVGTTVLNVVFKE